MALSAYFPYVAAVASLVAAGYFVHRLRATPDQFRTLSPVALYLGLIGLYFAVDGFAVFATTSCPGVDCTDLASGVAVMLAASFLARYPLRDAWPAADTWIFLGLVWGSVTVEVLLALIAPDLVLPVAYAVAAVVVGLVAVGYVGYQLVAGDAEDGIGGLDPGSPNVAALALVVAASAPLAGVALEIPLLSAVLAPIPVAAVYLFFERVELDPDPAEGVDARAAT